MNKEEERLVEKIERLLSDTKKMAYDVDGIAYENLKNITGYLWKNEEMEMNKKYLFTTIVLIIIVAGVAAVYISFQKDTPENQTLNVTKAPFLWRIEGENPSYLFVKRTSADQ